MAYHTATVLADLRRRAESALNCLVKPSVSSLSPQNTEALVHELRVHQIELELQNQELQRANYEVEDSRNRYRELYESIPIGYVTIDATGRIYDVNPAAARLLGIEHQRPALNNKDFFFFFFYDGDVDRITLFARKVIERQTPEVDEYRMKRADDSCYTAFLQAAPVQIGEGKEGRIRIAFQDITQQKYSEAELRSQRVELEANQAELRELTKKLFAAQEEERRRIARELHDDHCQRVTALILEANMLTKVCKTRLPDIAPRLTAMSQKLADLLSDFRSLSHELLPRNLGDKSLIAPIRDLIGEFSGKAGFEVKFVEPHVAPVIPPPIMTALFRLLQESLSNIAKHANAKRVTVTLTGTNHTVELHVTDDGVGFDPVLVPSKREATGIVGMRERLRPFGGTVHIISRPGQGATVTSSVPLPEST
jgi:PAS domain S-box-containing protein